MWMNLNLFMNKKKHTKMKNAFLYTIAAAFIALSCNEISIEAPIQYGTLSLTLAGEPSVDVVTKTDDASGTDDFSDYRVAVYTDETCSGTPSYGPWTFTELTAPIAIQQGDYYVMAESCTLGDAEDGNGCMRLEGKSSKVEVRAGQNTDVEISCSVANAKIEVVFDPSVAGKFTDNALTVTLSRETPSRELTATYADGNEEFWFNAGSTVNYVILGVSDATGQPITAAGTITNKNGSEVLASKDNVLLNIKVVSTGGSLVISPSVTTVVDKGDDIPAIFNPYE